MPASSPYPQTAASSGGGAVALDAATLAALETIQVGNFPATQAVTGTVALDSASLAALDTINIASLPALPAGTNSIGKVTPQTLVGRTLVTINFNSSAAAAADSLVTTLSVNRGGTVSTNQTSVAVSAGKTLRLTGALIFVRTTTAALPWGVMTLRMNSGAVVIGSPVVAQFGASGTAAVIGNAGSTNPCFDEGLEFSGAQQIGISYANNVATNVTAITLFGYEYTTPS